MRVLCAALAAAVVFSPSGRAAEESERVQPAAEESMDWTTLPVSILEAQIGYHPRNVKHVYLRSLQENPPEEFLASEFTVHDSKTDAEVFRGPVASWGRKWESFWWVLDFTPLRAPGEYYVKAGKLVSSPFNVEDGIYHKTGLDVVALTQLEERVIRPELGHKGLYRNAPPEVRIYKDCGGPYSELQPVGTCVYALMDLHDRLGGRFSEADRKRMLELARMGADYFVAAQRHTDDPETDGMFYHSLLVSEPDTWAGEIFTYLDTAYGMALTARAHQFFKDRDPERAARYLATAKKAWALCTHRPRHTKADRTLPEGANTYFWNYPPDTQRIQARAFYNILDEDWEMPDVLRTRDRLPFVQGSALLYEITGEAKYLEKAVEFADAIIERQFTDWENPIEGCFGNFYEFPGNDEVFFHEFMQGGFWWQGNVEALNLEGFMHLLRLAPGHPRAAAWRNAIETYAFNYARPASALNPLGIYPVACYRDPKHGGIKNFQNILMGSSCLFGFSTKNFMKLADFLQDSGFQTNALAGVNFIAGLNPGVPNAHEDTAWDARTLILGVGRSWFGPAHQGPSPKGSVPNGFCASPQFWQPGSKNFISYQPDRPAGLISPSGRLYFNEDWILHSHAYVQGVAHLEGPFTLTLNTLDDGAPAAAGVKVTVRETCPPHAEFTRTCRTSPDGVVVLSDLPTPSQGVVHLTHGDRVIERPVAAVAGGQRSWTVDFAHEADMNIQVPGDLAAGTVGRAVVTARNAGTKDLNLKLVLSASGVALERDGIELALKPGEKKAMEISFTCGGKVMPYLVRVWVADGAPARAFHATGRIHSAGTQP